VETKKLLCYGFFPRRLERRFFIFQPGPLDVRFRAVLLPQYRSSPQNIAPKAVDEILRDIAVRYLGTAAGNTYADNFPGHPEALVTLVPQLWWSEVLG
jgi:hypothetical protein